MLNFEYDENKSISNKQKHGVDFEESKILFDDKNKILRCSNYKEEKRYMVTGMISLKYFTAIITYRENNIRIISNRRARKSEIEEYERLNNEK